jgi:hypothetical protein
MADQPARAPGLYVPAAYESLWGRELVQESRTRPRIDQQDEQRADDQFEVTDIFTMGADGLCERGARALQIEIMGAFLDVRLNLLRSDIRWLREGRQSFKLNEDLTVVKAIGKGIKCLAGGLPLRGCVRAGSHVAISDNERG